MIKTIAGHFHPSTNEWVEQKEIEMHPLEERQIKASWDMNDARSQIPPKILTKKEFDWFLEFGPDFVINARKEWQNKYNDYLIKYDFLLDYYNECTLVWHQHITECLEKGVDQNVNYGN